MNVAHIESICLSSTRADAENLHSRYPGALSRIYTCDLFNVIKYRWVVVFFLAFMVMRLTNVDREGGGNTQRLDDPSRFNSFLTGSETQAREQLEALSQQLGVLRSKCEEANVAKTGAANVLRQLQREAKQFDVS